MPWGRSWILGLLFLAFTTEQRSALHGELEPATQPAQLLPSSPVGSGRRSPEWGSHTLNGWLFINITSPYKGTHSCRTPWVTETDLWEGTQRYEYQESGPLGALLEATVTHTFKSLCPVSLAGVAQLVGESSCKPKGHGFESRSGHMPRLWVRSLVRTYSLLTDVPCEYR